MRRDVIVQNMADKEDIPFVQKSSTFRVKKNVISMFEQYFWSIVLLLIINPVRSKILRNYLRIPQIVFLNVSVNT